MSVNIFLPASVATSTRLTHRQLRLLRDDRGEAADTIAGNLGRAAIGVEQAHASPSGRCR